MGWEENNGRTWWESELKVNICEKQFPKRKQAEGALRSRNKLTSCWRHTFLPRQNLATSRERSYDMAAWIFSIAVTQINEPIFYATDESDRWESNIDRCWFYRQKSRGSNKALWRLQHSLLSLYWFAIRGSQTQTATITRKEARRLIICLKTNMQLQKLDVAYNSRQFRIHPLHAF